MRMFIYRIPVSVFSQKIPRQNYSLTIISLNKRQAIAIAMNKAKQNFLARFPSHSVENMEIKVDAGNIEVKGSREIETKKRRPREPRLPFPSDIKLLETKVYKVGDIIVQHNVIEYQGLILFLLSSEKAKEIVEDGEKRLIILGYENRTPVYVKILTHNADGVPVLIRWEVEREKLVSSIEFIDGYQNYNSYIERAEYLRTKNIAEQRLKSLLKKEVANEKE